MKKGTVLVTGAYGFIGRHVSRLFGERGWQVTGVGHGVWSRDEWQTLNITEWHTCDVTIDSLLTYAGRPDVIVHCAGSGSVGFSMDHPLQDFHRTVDTTAHILEYAKLHAPEAQIVIPSSAGIYGIAETMPISEDSPLKPVSPYGLHKKMSEELCSSYGSYFGVSSAVVRLFSVYGEGLHKQLLWDSCMKLSGGVTQFFGTGDEMRDLLHVSDAAELLYIAAEHASPESPVANGGRGSGIMVRDVLLEIFACFGREDTPVFSGRNRPGDPFNYVADINRALSWGWKPVVDWKSGVREYVQWFKRMRSGS